MSGKPEKQQIRIRPTIIIGLGGTGGDVLLRIRKRFYERFGRLSDFPIVHYLWLDTDTTEKDILAGEVREYVRFGPTERLMTTIPDTTHYTNHLGEPGNRHIAPWWYRGLNALGRMTDGAGQIRPYSRLGFFHHYRDIRAAIVRAKGQVHDPSGHKELLTSPMLRQLGLATEVELNASTNVYLVCSIAGGTGSGMLMDMAFLLRDIFPGAEASLSAWLVFPGHFGSGILNDKMNANAYALLKELNHYNYGVPTFDVEWEPGLSRSMPTPPFDHCYLLDGTNAAGLVAGGRAESQATIFEMLAENIFKDFSHGDFATEKRSTRANLKQFMDDTYDGGNRDFPQAFIKRYQSLGLASISVPHARIVTACAQMLAARVVDAWAGLSRAGYNDAALPEFVNRAFLPTVGLVEEARGTRRDISHALLDREGMGRAEEGRSRGLLHDLDLWRDRTRGEIERGVHHDRRKSLRQYLEECAAELRLALRAEEESVEPDRWGAYARTVHASAQRLLADASERIRKEAFLLVDERNESIAYGIAVLKEVARALREAAASLKKRSEEADGRLGARAEEVKRRLHDIDLHTGRSNWDGRRATILRYDGVRFLDALVGDNRDPGEVRLALQKRVYGEGIGVCARLVEFVEGREQPDGRRSGGLLGELEQLRANFESMHDEFRKASLYFSRATETPLALSLYRSEDVEQKYFPAYVKGPAEIMAAGEACLREMERSITGLARDTSAEARERCRGGLLAQCRQRFERLPGDFHVVKLFYETFDEAERRQHLNQMLAASSYWVSRSPLLNAFELPSQQVIRMVGVPVPHPALDAGDFERVREFTERLKKDLQSLNPELIFSGVPDSSEIIFYQEAAGFPVNYLNSVKPLHEIYHRVCEQDPALHIDGRDKKFRDLLILDAEERRRLEEAQECFLLGCLFNVLDYVAEQYVWHRKEGIHRRPHPLGDRWRMVSGLAARDDLRSALLEEVRRKERAFSEQAGLEGALQLYVLLSRERRLAFGEAWEEGKEAHELPLDDALLVRAIGREVERVLTRLRSDLDDARLDRRAEDLDHRLEEWAMQRKDGRHALRVRDAASAIA
jgi:hypothetical protein